MLYFTNDIGRPGSTLQLTTSQLETIIAHARLEAPRECCGLGIGAENRIERLVAVRNVAPDTRHYEADPVELLNHFRAMDDAGESLVMIYHSHPVSPPVPSRTDLRLAFYPEAVYGIVSLADPAQPAFRAWRLIDGVAREVTVRLETDHVVPLRRRP